MCVCVCVVCVCVCGGRLVRVPAYLNTRCTCGLCVQNVVPQMPPIVVLNAGYNLDSVQQNHLSV